MDKYGGNEATFIINLRFDYLNRTQLTMTLNINIKYLRFALLLLLLPFYSISQTPKYSNEFLSIGVGARALGMSNCQVAITNDATSGFWNPAGLTAIQSNVEVAAMHSEYFAGIGKYDYGCIAAPVDKTSVIAFSLIRFAVDDIPDTTLLIDADGNVNYDRISSFSAADYAFLFSYARKSKYPGLTYGGNVKVIYRNVGSFANAWGFGLDAGIQYQHGNWKFGVMAKDITSTFNAWSFNNDAVQRIYNADTANALPSNSLEITLPKLLFGASYKTVIYGKFTAMPELDLDMTFDGQRNVLITNDPVSIDPHLGVEFGYNNFIFLRAGVGSIQRVKDFNGINTMNFQPSMGIGIKLKNLTIDYALTNINGLGSNNNASDAGLYSNVFSLKLDIYKHAK